MTAASVVFDASAMIRAVVGGSTDAWAALRRPAIRLVPDLLYAESASALATYCRAGELTAAEANSALSEILGLAVEAKPVASIAPAALEVALSRGMTAYDACYVALAEAADAPLVTADRKLAAAYERSELVA